MYKKLLECKIIPVIRTNTEEEALNLVEACIEGGSKAIELTYTIPNVCDVLEKVIKKFPEVLVGIGSVLTVEQAAVAIESGAQFVVSPGTVESVIEYCQESGIIYIPGCMTITEMINANEKGCSIVKLFPGNVFGANYISSIKAPMPNITIMVTGGVDLENIEEWKKAGTDLIGIGSALNKEIINDDYTGVVKLTRKYMELA